MVVECARRKPNWTGEIRLLWRQKLKSIILNHVDEERIPVNQGEESVHSFEVSLLVQPAHDNGLDETGLTGLWDRRH